MLYPPEKFIDNTSNKTKMKEETTQYIHNKKEEIQAKVCLL